MSIKSKKNLETDLDLEANIGLDPLTVRKKIKSVRDLEEVGEGPQLLRKRRGADLAVKTGNETNTTKKRVRKIGIGELGIDRGLGLKFLEIMTKKKKVSKKLIKRNT